MAQIRKGPFPDSATFPAIPSVNLLDPSVEPTDEELLALMQDFMKVVTERDKAGRIALQRDLGRRIRGAVARAFVMPSGFGAAARNFEKCHSFSACYRC